jgi:hypothetical protein
MTSQTSYSAGLDPEVLKLFGQKLLPASTGAGGAEGAASLAMLALKRGAKLVPRQK